jgi:ribosomal protein S18 acetylase RimI-like enzyme
MLRARIETKSVRRFLSRFSGGCLPRRGESAGRGIVKDMATGHDRDTEVLALERAAFEAWQAEEIVSLGAWQLRFMRGVTDRANSVWAGPGEPTGGFDTAVARAEAFYAERGRPALFQISPISHTLLDARLEHRGYARYDEVSLQVARAADVARIAPRSGLVARCDAELGEEWFALSGLRGRFGGAEIGVYRAFLARVASRAGFARAREAGASEIGGVGLTIVAPPLAGVFSMLTAPELRKRGLAEAVMGELARFAVQRGAERLYLQVSAENAPACALYARAGFVESHRYHYRRRS